MSTLLIAGASGLVGRECLQLALNEPAFTRIVTVSRRPLTGVQSSPRLESHLVDFARLHEEAPLFAVTAILCALGTTIRQAGSQARFREVDHDYVVQLARLGLSQNAQHFLLVSAMGANAESRLFYNRVKGETERDVSALPYRSLTIARPSLLLGDREELRIGERVGQMLGWAMPAKYRPIHARAVAAALIAAAKRNLPGTRILQSAEMAPRSATARA